MNAIFSGYVNLDNKINPISVNISNPIPYGQDWLIKVYIIPLDNTPKKIFGINAEQAIQLACRFAAIRLADFQILDVEQIPQFIDEYFFLKRYADSTI